MRSRHHVFRLTVWAALICGPFLAQICIAGQVPSKSSASQAVHDVDVVPLPTLRELMKDSASIVVGRVQSAEQVAVEPGSSELYLRVSVSIEKPTDFLKGTPQSGVVLQADLNSDIKQGQSILAFLGSAVDGLATPVGLERGIFHIDGERKFHFATVRHTARLWTQSDPVWMAAPKHKVADRLRNNLADLAFHLSKEEIESKIQELLDVGDHLASPDTLPLDLVIAVIQARSV